MICGYDPCVLNGLDYMPKQKNRHPVSMFFHLIQLSVFYYIKEISATEA